MRTDTQPTAMPNTPVLGPNDKVVLFDGVCRLCAAWAKFLIRFDRQKQFRLASVQSSAGHALLKHHGLPTDQYHTMVLLEGEQVYTQSTAFLRVMRRLPFPWPFFNIALIVPGPIRDWLYDRIALNRYRLFGRYDTCVLPKKDHNARFLDD
ncbi:thiol-disulfide oxidoreductase [Bacterioplanes sanyensis]|uniref:Thiol-disulfide oxidoreductase n=1 Tax=Bacterioplanes sanyensis TaxID=1249553 RepID=A0A222FGQ6_9GAMM|nr:thiol-disulfide oxidoreductase DCC family protein [Bacterioplanes sanyensis]ASP37929.1 thiol-disulfide oxidoreductase [Bacterioplanes sanyensis]